MPEQVNRIDIRLFGGLNQSDQENVLLNRSHEISPNGFVQRYPSESPELLNIDFDSQGITKRKGSTSHLDITGVMVADDELIRGTEIIQVSDNAHTEVIVSKKTIYTNESGSFAQINKSDGVAYLHANDVTRVDFAYVDGHLFIGMDGTDNTIQVYRGGANLDPHFHNHASTTTVDVTSSSGQTVLSVADTSFFLPNDCIIINEGGGREEEGCIASIQDGVSLTLDVNLTYTHTAGQADEVKIKNLYYNTFDSGSNAYTGSIDHPAYMINSFHSRLVFSDGDTLVYYSPVAGTSGSGIWDMGGSTAGFIHTAGHIRALMTMTPYLTNTLNEILYIGTDAGLEILTGFTSSDEVSKIEGSGTILNHESYALAKQWIIYLTADKNILAVNGSTVIDLGRRLRNTAGTAILDEMDETSSLSDAFGFYSRSKEQAYFFFTTDSARKNDSVVVIDFKLGEPIIGEPLSVIENRVRLLNWKIDTPDTNDWFLGLYNNETITVGITAAGVLYQFDNGTDDLGTLAVSAFWKSPVIIGNSEFISKQWLDVFFRGIVKGDWPVYVDVFIDRAADPSKTFSFNQGSQSGGYGTATYGASTYDTSLSIKGDTDVDIYSETIQWKIYNESSGETFLSTNQGLRFLIGSEER